MWNLISLVFLTVIIVYVTDKFSNIYNLLSGVSDDINGVRKKLGLKTEIRTKKQIDDNVKRSIREVIYVHDGKIEELRKNLGDSEFRKHKRWIEFCLQSYSKMKICLECDTIYTSPESKECKDCKIQLVSTREHKPPTSIILEELDRIEDELGEHTGPNWTV